MDEKLTYFTHDIHSSFSYAMVKVPQIYFSKIIIHLLWIFRYTIFATHMENLSELASIYPNVKILHFYVDIRNNRLDFKVAFPWFIHSNFEFWLLPLTDTDLLIQFQLKEGPRHVPHYGLLLAEVAGLPSSVIETARGITSRITQKVISVELKSKV